MSLMNAKVPTSVVEAVKGKFDFEKEAVTNLKISRFEATRY